MSMDERIESPESVLARYLEANNISLLSLFDAMPDAFMAINQSGLVIYTNHLFQQLFGYDFREIQGKPIEAFMPERYRQSHQQHRFHYVNKPHVRPMGEKLELFGLHKNGHEFPIEISLSPLKTTEDLIIIATIRNISHDKKMALQLNNDKQQLEIINHDLEQFAYVVSHDLKAPLRAIENLISWIEEDFASEIQNKHLEYYNLLKQRVRRMGQLVEGILQYSRIGSKEPEIIKVDVEQLLKTIIEDTHRPDGFNVTTEVSLPPINSSAILLTQVLTNLINNAIVHHDQCTGEIHVSATLSNNHVEFTVKDNGPGIAEEHIDKAFEMFQTLKPSDANNSTGLGLSIVKKIVESQGGKIWIENNSPRGAVFKFTWPVNEM